MNTRKSVYELQVGSLNGSKYKIGTSLDGTSLIF